MQTLSLEKPRGFALKAATEFYAGFTPGSGMAVAAADHLRLAFRLDRTFQAVAVELREDGNQLVAQIAGDSDPQAAARQLRRMLGLDADAEAWLALGRKEVVVGQLQAEFPGFHTAAKASPYDAAAWGVLSPRMSMAAAAQLKLALSQQRGEAVALGERAHHVFPSPNQVLSITDFPGLPTVKLERLHGIARAALEGQLDAERLRSLPVDEALTELRRLPGVGPWTASHILFRGAALVDGLPTAEPRVLHGLAAAYGAQEPTVANLTRVAESWRPFRTWVCILLARHLAASGGWHKPGLAQERAALARRQPTRAD